MAYLTTQLGIRLTTIGGGFLSTLSGDDLITNDMSYYSNLVALNAICVASGGTGGHPSMLPALNELCSLQGVETGHLTSLPALNAIDAGLGGTGLHLTNLASLNSICELISGAGGHVSNLSAWNEIATLGFKVFYVDAEIGSDLNNGSSEEPFKTLKKASTVATTYGSVIKIRPGTYVETERSTIAAGVSIEGDDMDFVTIVSNYASGAITDNANCLLYLNSATISDGDQYIKGITFDGDDLTGKIGISIINRNNVEVYNCRFQNFHTGACGFYGTTYEGNQEPTTYLTGNSFHDNIVDNCSLQGSFPCALWFGGNDGFEAYNNTMTQTTRGTDDGFLIKSNTNKRVKIYNNNLTLSQYVDDYHFAMEVRYTHGESEIYNNTCLGEINMPHIFKKSGMAWGMKVHDNVVKGWTSPDNKRTKGVQMEGSCTDVYIYDNYIENVAFGVYASHLTATLNQATDIYIYRNTFNNICYSGSPGGNAVYYDGLGAPTITNVFIYNNTMKAYNTGAYAYQRAIQLPRGGTVSNFRVRNNIITKFSYAPIYSDVAETLAMDGIYITNNCFFDNNSSGAGSNLPIFTAGAEAVRTNYTFANNIQTDPLINSSLEITAGSPCINAGVDVGLPFTGTAPDIGFNELE